MKGLKLLLVGAVGMLSALVPSVYGQPTVLTTSTTQNATAWNNGVRIAKNGSTIYAVFMTATNDIRLYKSANNGVTWNEDILFHDIPPLQPIPHHPSISLAGNGNPRDVYVSTT